MGAEQSLANGVPPEYAGYANGVPGLPPFDPSSEPLVGSKRRSNGRDDASKSKWTRKAGHGGGGKGGAKGSGGTSTGDDGSSELECDESAGASRGAARGDSSDGLSAAARKKAAAADAKFIEWAPHEDQLIRDGVQRFGFKWTQIAKALPGRTDNAVRNRWKRLEEGESWRQSMVGEGVDVHALPPDQVPGYKCRKCGQPKRGHTCPFNAPPLAPPNFEPAPIARGASGGGARLEPTASGRIGLDALQSLLAEGRIDAPLPGSAGSSRGATSGGAVVLGGAGAGAGAGPEAQRGALPSPPAELGRNSSSIEKLLNLSRDFSFSWLRSLGGGSASGQHAAAAAAAAAAMPSTGMSGGGSAEHAQSSGVHAAPPAPPNGAARVPALAPSLVRGFSANEGGGIDAESIEHDLRRLGLPIVDANGTDAAGAGGVLPSPQFLAVPPPLERTGSSSFHKLVSLGKEFSLSFLADALGVSPGKRRSSSMSNGGGDHAGYTPRR